MNPIKHPLAIALLLGLATLSLSACNKAGDEAAVIGIDDAKADAAAPEASAPAPKPAGFDIENVPVSTVALGDFPFLTLPEGCRINP